MALLNNPLALSTYSTPQICATIGILWLLYLIFLVIYRLYLSPLANVPGPKLAAVTPWYEFFYEHVKRGKYTWEVMDMHAKYGPIVRISPREVHIDDPDYYNTLFSRHLDRDPWVVRQFAQNYSTQATASVALHRARRAAIAPFFSQTKVMELQSVITNKIEKLCRLLGERQRNGEPANMYNYYRGLTTDVITEYTFLEAWNFLDRRDSGQEWFDSIMGALETGALLRHFPFIVPIMQLLPNWLVPIVMPDLRIHIEVENIVGAEVKAATAAGPDLTSTGKQHPTIYRELIYHSNLSASEKSQDRMIAEGTLIVVAGAETTGMALNALHYHLLANPEKMKRLKAELAEVLKDQSDVPSWQQLKKLPYLSACIDEILRLSSGVIHRLARLAPKEGLKWRDITLPAGTPVSMSSYHMHMNAEIFPNPAEFLPERWLPAEAKGLKKYLAPFARGPRHCLGIELAYAELYLATAIVHRRFDTELFETTREDIDIAHDFFLGSQRIGSKGLQVKMR